MTSGLSKRLVRLLERFPRVASVTAGYILAALALLVTWTVFMRYILREPVAWSHELGGFVFIFASAAGVSYALQERRHIGVDLLVNRLRHRKRQIADIFSLVVTLGWGGVVLWGTLTKALFTMKAGQIGDTIRFPLFPLELVAPAGMVIFLLIGVLMLRRKVAQLGGAEAPPAEESHREDMD